MVPRRYSSFEDFHRRLKAESYAPLPPLPPKQQLGRFTPGFITERQKALDDYLQKLIAVRSFPFTHWFIVTLYQVPGVCDSFEASCFFELSSARSIVMQMHDTGEHSLVTRQLRSKLLELTSSTSRLALLASASQQLPASDASSGPKNASVTSDGGSKYRDASVQATLGPCTRDRIDSLRGSESPLFRSPRPSDATSLTAAEDDDSYRSPAALQGRSSEMTGGSSPDKNSRAPYLLLACGQVGSAGGALADECSSLPRVLNGAPASFASSVSAGGGGTFAWVTPAGDLYTWGRGPAGILGHGDVPSDEPQPKLVRAPAPDITIDFLLKLSFTGVGTVSYKDVYSSGCEGRSGQFLVVVLSLSRNQSGFRVVFY